MRRFGGAVLEGLGRVFHRGTVSGADEGMLLDRFVVGGDEAAFAAIVARHGPMVLGVCRRALRDEHDAEDAFQATFLVLARRAAGLRDGDLLGRWLHGVARRVALRARARGARRDARERTGTGAEPIDEDSTREEAPADLRAVLDDELARLPESLRSPLVLCYLDGLTHEEAAVRLRWPVGTVRSRMARGRDLLRARLARRGLTAAGAALAAAVAPAPVSASLVDATARASLLFLNRQAIAHPAVAMAVGVLNAMTLSKLKLLGVAALAGLITVGVAPTLARQLGGAAAESPRKDDDRKALEAELAQARAGLVRVQADLALARDQADLLRARLDALEAGPGTGDSVKFSGPPRTKNLAKSATPDSGPGEAFPGMSGAVGPVGPGFPGGAGIGPGGPGMAAGGMGPGMSGAVRPGRMGMMGGAGAGMLGAGGRGMGAVGGMGGIGRSAPGFIQAGRFMVVTSPRGDKVAAVDNQSGAVKSVRLSEPGEAEQSVLPVIAGKMAALWISGPRVKRIAALSTEDGTWYPRDLIEPATPEPGNDAANARPIVGFNVAVYVVGRHAYAFSPGARRWDVVELPRGAPARPVVDYNDATFQAGSHCYIFSGQTGRWTDIDLNAVLDTPDGEPAAPNKP